MGSEVYAMVFVCFEKKIRYEQVKVFMPNVKNLLSPKYLIIFVFAAILIFFVSQYIAANYGLPKWMTIQIKTEKDILLSVYYDVGNGYGEDYKISQWILADSEFQIVKLSLPLKYIKSFRIDPMTEPGPVYIKSIELSSFFGKYHLWAADSILQAFHPAHDISKFEPGNKAVKVESSGNDPYFMCIAPVPKFRISFIWIFILLAVIVLIGTVSIGFLYRYREKLLNTPPWIWLGLIILVALVLRIYHVSYPLNDLHAFRQTQTAGLIRDFYRDGINLLYPRIITLGDPGYVVLEFPLYQAISAILYHVFNPNVIYARLASIFFGLLSIIFVYRLTKRFLDHKTAIFAALFFAFMPLNIFFNRVPIPDTLTILLSLIMLDFMIEGINNRKNIFLFFGIIAGSLGLMMKSPYVAPLFLPVIYIVYRRERKLKAFFDIRFVAAFIIPVTMMILWQQHANSVNEKYFNNDYYPFSELYSAVVVKLHPFNTWYFGTIAQRLDISNYLIIIQRIFKEILSMAGLFFLIAGFITLIKKKIAAFFLIWLCSVLLSILLFFNLNIIHNYYQLPLTPILAIFCGAGATYLSSFFQNKKVAFTLTAVFISFYLIMSYSIALEFFEKTNESVVVGQFIDRSMEGSAMLAVSQPGESLWSPELIYHSDRHGFYVPHSRLNEEMIEYLRRRNIKALALVDYKGGNDLIDATVASYRVIAQNFVVTIYDISSMGSLRANE
jgi:hypothetical protein